MARMIAGGRIHFTDDDLPAFSREFRTAKELGVSVAIMAHRRRERHIPYLLERLGDVPVIWDQGNDRWETGTRAMAAYDPAAKYHIVVQDDAILSTDFLAAAAEVVRSVPFGPVGFYMGQISPYPFTMQRAIQAAIAQRASYLTMRGPHWGVAVAVPTCLIAAMLEFCKTVPVENYDLKMERFFTANDLLCTYTLPSLVNHRVGNGNPSLVPNRGNSHRRVAYEWTGRRSALDYDWQGALFDVSTVDSNQATRRFNAMAKKHRVYVRDAKGRAVLVAQQPVTPEPADLSKLTVAEIRRVAQVKKVDLSGLRRKAQMIEAIEAAA